MKQSIKKPQRVETCVNDLATSRQIDTKLARDCSLPVLILHLARAQRKHAKPAVIGLLIRQCRNYDKFPGMGQRIIETIDTLVDAEHRA